MARPFLAGDLTSEKGLSKKFFQAFLTKQITCEGGITLLAGLYEHCTPTFPFDVRANHGKIMLMFTTSYMVQFFELLLPWARLHIPRLHV